MMDRQPKTDILLNTLASRMRERRKTLGITQEQLAEKAGLSPNFVGKLELGQRVPSFNTLICLAETLEVEVYELLAVSANRPWAGASREVERVMESLPEQDAAFMLREFQHIADYLKSLRKDQD
jgi:transcriptional regulator with XRE-family HTH domain